MNLQSIRVRLAAWNALLVIATFAATGIFSWLAIRDSLSDTSVPAEERRDTLNEFAWTMVMASPAVLVAAAAGGYAMSRRALQPVDRITRTAQVINARSLTSRLPLRGVDDELERLSETLNGMFARLEDGFRRVTQFTADASHELRTPTAVIRTTAEVTRARPRTEREYVTALDRILTESERMSRLIEDLLLLARSDADADRLTLEPMDLADVLGSACAEAEILARAAGVRLTSHMPTTFAATGDPDALRRLFVILLDNAVKYTAPGGVIDATMQVDGAVATVDVRDTGAGIAAADVPRIFERFYRVAADRSRATGGTGLGLAIAQWIATSHDGEIRVDSELGVGSVFHVSLPVGAGR
jgi:heavy metal sensor kinase